MKKTILTRVLALIGAVLAVVSVAIVPTFADSEPVFEHSLSDLYDTFSGTDRFYQVTGSGNDEWLAYGDDATFQYNEIAQVFFDKFAGSSGKYILPVEYYKTVDGVNSLIDGYTTVSCPDYFDLSYCAVMIIRMNARGQLYRFWTYAENFKVESTYQTLNGDGEEVPRMTEQIVQIEYDVIPSDENTSWWQDTIDAGLPSSNGLPWEYWSRDTHVDYLSDRYVYEGGEYCETVYDTMRFNDTNAFNYTLCYVVVSIEQIVIDYASKESYLEGYEEGHTDGYDEGYEYGLSWGESWGYDLGHADGQLVGYEVGLWEGYNNGYADGEKVGWDNGVAEGITETANTGTMVRDTVFAIVESPIRLIEGVLDFNFLGIHLASFVKSLISIVLVAVVILIFVKILL